MTRFLLAGACALALSMPVAQAAVSTQFDTTSEGWQVVDFNNPNLSLTPQASYTPNWLASGGAAGAYIDFHDPSSGSFYFSASTAYLGDLSSYFGGRLSYAQQVFAGGGSEWRDNPDLILIGNGQAYVYQHATNPGSSWQQFAVTLDGAGWHRGTLSGATVGASEFQTALGSVSALYVRGEYINGVFETTGLDNVALNPVPEPETWAMLIAGLGVVAWARRRQAQ
ncbi:MAG: laminin B domain-containing protein [Chitinivorax sp.]